MPPLQRNAQMVLDRRQAEPAGMTRAQLIDDLPVSRATIFRVVRTLVEDGWVIETMSRFRTTRFPDEQLECSRSLRERVMF